MKISATIPGNPPSKANTYRVITVNGHGAIAKGQQAKRYAESFMWHCGKLRDLNIDVPFEIYFDAYFSSKAHDLDNALKEPIDLMGKVKTFKNDNLVMKIVARKFIDKENPRVEITIKTLDDEEETVTTPAYKEAKGKARR